MDYFVSTDKSLLNIEMIVDFLTTQAYWSIGRSRDTIEKSIRNSMCFGLYTKERDQIGFARVVSDLSVYAWLMDVFVLPQYRGNALGKFLVGEILAHPDLQGLQRWGLGTRDAHGLYAGFGFTPLKNPHLFMEMTNKPR